MNRARFGLVLTFSLCCACSGDRSDELGGRDDDSGTDGGEQVERDAAGDGLADGARPADDGGADLDGGPADADGAVTVDAGPIVPATFVSPTGDDQAAGTREAPLRTLARAFGVGSNVVLLDGTFDLASQAPANSTNFPLIDVPAGTRISADHAGMAIIEGRNAPTATPNRRGLAFLGAGSITGVTLRGFTQGLTAVSGTVDITGVRFEEITDTGLAVSGTALANLSNPAGALYTDANTRGVAQVSDDAELHVTGGRVEGGIVSFSCSTLFRATDRSKLFLQDLTLANGLIGAVSTGGSAQASLLRVSIDQLGNRNNCFSVIYLNGATSTLNVSDSTIVGSDWAGISNNNNNSSVVLNNSSITGSENVAVSMYAPPVGANSGSFVANNVHFDDNLLGGVVLTRLGSVSLNNVTVLRNARDGLELSQVPSVRVRSSSVSSNGWAGVRLINATADAMLDFGTLAEPGGNTFLNNFTQRMSGQDRNFYNQTAAGTVTQAVGNTWNPVQGADAQGHYTSAAATSLDATNLDAAGSNYVVTTGGGVLRLAQSP